MKRLHRLILKSFVGPFVLIFFIVLFILLMQFLWRYIDDLVGKGLEFKVIAELLLYTSSTLVPMALPLAILMSSLMTFGNMGEFYELTAIKASGISLQRVMMPLMILIILVSIGAFFFANEVLPYTNLKFRSLLYDVRNQRPEIQVVPGSFYNGIDGYSMRIDRKDPNTNIFYDIKIYDHSDRRGNTNVIIADSGKMIVTSDERFLIFTLYNGYGYNEVKPERKARKNKTYPHSYDTFDEREMIIELVGFSLERTDENLFRGHYTMLKLSQLANTSDSIQKKISEKEDILARTLIAGNYFKKRNYNRERRKSLIKYVDSLRNDHYPFNPSATNLPVDSNRRIRSTSRFGRIDSAFLLAHLKDSFDQKTTDSLALSDNINEFADATGDTGINSNQKAKEFKHASPDYCDSLIAQLTLREKELLYNEALSYARSARTHVNSSVHQIDREIKRLRRFEIERQRKFTIAFSCFVFLLIGAPLGAIIRKGGLGLPLVISTLFFIFYYIISLMGEKFVRESYLPDYQGMWISSAVFFVIGSFLTYKATTDAAILNMDTYTNFLKKVFGFRKRSLIEVIEKEIRTDIGKQIKHETIIASLSSFHDTINELSEDVNTRIKFPGYLFSLIGLREISNLILFERLYKNIIYSISKSDLIQYPTIQRKLAEFPNFKYQNYYDQKSALFIRLILLLLPPVTLIIIVRHYIQFTMLKEKLKIIDQLTKDIIGLINKTDFIQ